MNRVALLLISFTLLAASYPAGAALLNATCATVNDVIAIARAGDEVVLENGVCNNLSIDFKPRENGTRTSPITLRPQTPLGVTFSGNETSFTWRGDWLIVDGFRWDGVRNSGEMMVFKSASHCRLTGSEIVDSGGSTGFIRLRYGSRHNTIDHNLFDNIGWTLIQVWGYDGDLSNTDNRIAWNHFRNTSGREQIQIGQGERFKTGSTNDPVYRTIVEYNLFENMGAVSGLISNKTSGNIIRYNTLRNVKDRIVLRQGQGSEVYGNWLFNTKGIRAWDADHKIYNNYLEGHFPPGNDGIEIWAGSASYPTINDDDDTHWPAINVLVAYNTIINVDDNHLTLGAGYNMEFPPGRFWTEPTRWTTVKNNLITNSSGTAIWVKGAVNSAWVRNIVYPTDSGTQGHSGPGVLNTNPNLTPIAGIKRLQSSSTAAIAQAVPIVGITEDIFGRPRNPSKPSIGAEEWSTDPILRLPLTAADVGPGSSTPTTLLMAPQGVTLTIVPQ